MTYLVDTDWVVDWLAGRQAVRERLEQAAAGGLAISAITLAELWEGVYYSRDPGASERTLREFLAGVTLITLDAETCQVFGRERGRLRKAGDLIADLDLLIGATALRRDLTVLTNNRRDFERIQRLRLESV